MLAYRYEMAQFTIEDRLRDVAREHLARVAADGRRPVAHAHEPEIEHALRSALHHARLAFHPAGLRPHHLSR